MSAREEGQQVEVGVLFAPSDIAVQLLGLEREVVKRAGDVWTALNERGEGVDREPEGERAALEEG
jgi:hypothetical protein